jgi:hypothetical protein
MKRRLVAGARVGDEPRLNGIERLDIIFDILEEDRLPVAHDLRDAEAVKRQRTGSGAIRLAHEPLRVADHNARAGG